MLVSLFVFERMMSRRILVTWRHLWKLWAEHLSMKTALFYVSVLNLFWFAAPFLPYRIIWRYIVHRRHVHKLAAPQQLFTAPWLRTTVLRLKKIWFMWSFHCSDHNNRNIYVMLNNKIYWNIIDSINSAQISFSNVSKLTEVYCRKNYIIYVLNQKPL